MTPTTDRRYEHALPRVSALVITRNEERNIARCLQSLYWVHEIVVVDAMSSDATVTIAQEHGAKVFSRSWPGYVQQREFALSKATGKWVISLDADEELSAELIYEIATELSRVADQTAGFDMPRICNYLGKWIRHGEWYPDRQLRLFMRSEAIVTGMYVHESFVVTGEVSQLKEHIRHYSYSGLRDHARRMRHYAKLVAGKLNQNGIKWSMTKMLSEPALRGWNNYVRLRGFMDGYRGAVITAMIVYYAARIHFELLSLRMNGEKS